MIIDIESILIIPLYNEILHTPKSGNQTLDLGKLEVLSGVKAFPARVKCATLAWHTLLASLDGSDSPIKTE